MKAKQIEALKLGAKGRAWRVCKALRSRAWQPARQEKGARLAGSLSGAVSKAKAALAKEGPPKRERSASGAGQVLRRAVRPAAASELVESCGQAGLQRNRKASVCGRLLEAAAMRRI